MREAGRPTVMVAHNDEDTRSLLRFWLEAEGYSVVVAADGQEAVELTGGKCPDLILMSERMPKLGGLEAARRIRWQGEEYVFPIVAMSAYPTAAAQAAAINAGCDSFIPQPVDFDLLGDLLSRLLRGAAGGRRERARAGIALSP
jgi:two-component system, OmpR family, phosphate regulon response regulator PhoB